MSVLQHRCTIFWGRWGIVPGGNTGSWNSGLPFINWRDRWRSGIANMSRPAQSVWAGGGEEFELQPCLRIPPTLCVSSLPFPKELLLIVPPRWKHLCLWRERTRIWENYSSRECLKNPMSSVTRTAPFCTSAVPQNLVIPSIVCVQREAELHTAFVH